MSKEIEIHSSQELLVKAGNFIDSASVDEIKKLLPGIVTSPGQCFFPTHIPVTQDFNKFRIVEVGGTPRALCFSKLVFFGTVDGADQLQNLSEFASCQVSSLHKSVRNPRAALDGNLFSNNIHTDREEAPWWEASFPENVSVKQIYFFRRADWHITHESNLRILGVGEDGRSEVLYCPEDLDACRETAKSILNEAMASLARMQKNTDAEAQSSIQQKLKAVTSCLVDWIDFLSGHANKKPNVGLKEGVSDPLIELIKLSLGGPKDFGLEPDTGLDVEFEACPTAQVRVRTYGELPPGVAGLELYEDGTETPVQWFNAADMKSRYYLGPQEFPQSFIAGLQTQVRSRRLNLGGVFNINRFRAWNVNQQHAANTLFLEVAVRPNEDSVWTIVHDQGASYRNAVTALRLVNALIRSSWTEQYASLLGKLFSLYRRKNLMSPLAKLVRHREPLSKAVFAGSDEVWPKTRYAAPLRLGKHGLRVPVAFRDQNTVMGHMTEMRDKIRALGHKPLLMYGTLLGAIREKDFIPHDDDVDLAVVLPISDPDELSARCEEFIDLLNENDIKANRGAAHSPLIHCHRGVVTYDIFILGHVGDTIYWPHTALKVVPERADIFLPIKTIEFKGEEFDGPNDPEAVCQARYGDGWHVPNPAFEW